MRQCNCRENGRYQVKLGNERKKRKGESGCSNHPSFSGLVPKLCLGMPLSANLRFENRGPQIKPTAKYWAALRNPRFSKQSFADTRVPNREIGNEGVNCHRPLHRHLYRVRITSPAPSSARISHPSPSSRFSPVPSRCFSHYGACPPSLRIPLPHGTYNSSRSPVPQ